LVLKGFKAKQVQLVCKENQDRLVQMVLLDRRAPQAYRVNQDPLGLKGLQVRSDLRDLPVLPVQQACKALRVQLDRLVAY
jgi:hypothetical protein